MGFRVTIGGADATRDTRLGSIHITRPLNARPTARVALDLPTADLATRMPAENVELVIEHTALPAGRQRVFGGYVHGPEIEVRLGTPVALVRVPAVGYASRLDARRIRGYVRTGENQVVGDVVRAVMRDHADGEGMTTTQVDASDVVRGDVFDYITVAEALSRLADQANCIWCVDPYLDLVFRSRDSLTVSSVVLREGADGNLQTIRQRSDRQHWRNVQTVIGATPQAGQRREDFTGDGARREYPLQYRVDRVVEVSVNGVSQGFTAETDPWSVDTARSVLVHDAAETPLASSDELSVLYNYNFPIVVTRENAASVAAWRTIHHVEQDAALDTMELAEDRAETLLARHDFPTTVIDVTTVPGSVVGLNEGDAVTVEIPSLGVIAPAIVTVPSNLVALAGDQQVTLEWDDPQDNAITGYEIRWSTAAGATWTDWATIAGSGASTTAHTVTGLTNGTAYTVEVRVVVGDRNGPASDRVTATPA